MKEFDHGSFTPVVFSIYGSMGRECRTFYNRLGKKIPEKQELHQSIVTNWIVTKISFALLKSALLCLRGAKDLEHFLSHYRCKVMTVVIKLTANK